MFGPQPILYFRRFSWVQFIVCVHGPFRQGENVITIVKI